jgi:hypothetical protein
LLYISTVSNRNSREIISIFKCFTSPAYGKVHFRLDYLFSASQFTKSNRTTVVPYAEYTQWRFYGGHSPRLVPKNWHVCPLNVSQVFCTFLLNSDFCFDLYNFRLIYISNKASKYFRQFKISFTIIIQDFSNSIKQIQC